MADNNFYCQFCDRTLHTKNEFDQHCNGKKHKSNRQAAQEHDAANRSLFIHGHEGINNSTDILQAYFTNFGKVEKITFGGKNGCGYAVVEFGEVESLSKALKVRHRIGTLALSVKKYQIRPSPYQLNKVIQQELEQNEKTKQARAKDDMMSMLLSASSVIEQINLLAQSLKLDVSDQKARVLICTQLIKLFTPHYGHCNIYQFGSSINGFGAKGCDLDLFLDLSDQIAPNSASKSKVKKLGQIISSSPHFTNSLIIPSHRCPVVKFSHKATEIKCDLSINNRKALHNSYLLRLYSSEPRVHNLVSIVRMWAKSLELAGSSGGAHLFTSYSITLIVLFFLMRREPKIVPLVCDIEKCVPGTRREMVDDWECTSVPENAQLPPSDNKETDLELVKEFFTFYSSSVDWDRDAFVTRNATIFPRSSISLDPDYIGCKAACMTLLDPFVLTHNVVGNVNAKTKERFVTELKRAAQLVNSWSQASPSTSSSAWGIAALLTPASPTEPPGNKPGQKAKKVLASGQDAGTRDSPTKSNVTPVEGEQENGDFCITVQPLAQTMLRTELLSAAKCNNVTPTEQWCIMAQELIVKVLQTVFMVEVEEDAAGSKDEVVGSKEGVVEPKEGVVEPKEGVVEPKEEVARAKEDVALPKEDVAGPKEELAGSKEEVALPKEKVALPKEEVALPKEEVAGLKEEVALPKEEACLNVTGQPASEHLGEGGSKDSKSVPMEENCDSAVRDSASLSDSSRSSESECDVHAGSYGKRTSDAAHLDVNVAELVSAVSSDSDSQPKDTVSNPKKRFCEGVTGKTAEVHDQVIGTHLGNDSSIIKKNVDDKSNSVHILDDCRTSVDDKYSSTVPKDSRDVIPNSCALNKTLPSGNLSTAKNLPEKHIDTTINPGASSEIKTLKIASYSCRCQKQLWISRKKTAAELPKKPSLTALELEQEISNHVLRKQSGLMLRQEMSRVQVNSAEVGHPLARNDDDKQLMMKAVNGQNKDIPPAGQICVNKAQVIEFSCQILHQNVNSDLHLPHIVVKLRPAESSSNQFKNFYCSFRTLILNLIMKHFLEVYK